jgi:cell wall-associated NlpC family hydrolase
MQMDKTIKTRNVVKDIKALDKRAAGLAAVRSAHAKTREAAEGSEPPEQQYRHGNGYAEAKAEQAGKAGAKATGHGAAKGVRKTVDAVRDAKSAAKEARQGAQTAAPGTQKAAAPARQKAVHAAPRQAAATARQQAVRTAPRQAARRTATRAAATARQAAAASNTAAATTGRAAKATIKQGAKGTVKTATKGVKTAGTTAGKAVKTTRHAAQASKAAAKATGIAAQRAAQAARAATKAAAATTKAAAKGVAAFVRMAIAAVRSLVAAIAAGGWVAVAVIVIVCLVGLVASSAFGIFFAGEDTGDGNPSMREAIAGINQEHQERIEQIKADNPHDEVMATGTRAAWREVLAVYAVKTTTDTQDPLDAITLDGRRQQMLKDTYWDMNTIEWRTEDRESTEIVAVEQEDGTITEETQAYTRRILIITQSARSAGEMADEYGLDDKQRGLLSELLAPEHASAWQSVLYGIRSGAGDIVEVAALQLGNPGGQPYWGWYGFPSRVEWCACFVSWCANEAGYIEAGTVPRFSYCQTGIRWFQDAGCWQDAASGYEPKPGDIIFFDWGDGGDSDHVGIVESSDGVTVRTIEGNSADAVRRCSYSLGSPSIIGYGTP